MLLLIGAFSLTSFAASVQAAALPQPIIVTTTADHGAGSLRTAIALANQTPGDSVIDLSRVSGTITLQRPLPKIHSNLTLAGNGDDILSGNDAVQVLSIERGTVTLENFTIAHGLAQGEHGKDGTGGAAGMGGGFANQQRDGHHQPGYVCRQSSHWGQWQPSSRAAEQSDHDQQKRFRRESGGNCRTEWHEL